MFVSKIKSEQCSRCKINNQRAQNTNKRNNIKQDIKPIDHQ